MSRTAIITGATGFIGSALVSALSQAGWNVIALCRNPKAAAETGRVVYRRYKLGDALEYDGDALVHCAYESRDDREENVNVRGSAALIESARARGVPRILFLSSLAASNGAHSRYGEDKFRIEQMLDLRRDAIVRPGLVIGNGGLFGNMAAAIRRTHAAPVFRGGRQPVYTVALDDLCMALVRLIEAEATGAFTIAFPEPIALKDLLTRLGRRFGFDVQLIPLPYTATLRLIGLAEKFGLKLPISAESVRGIQNLRPLDIPSYSGLGITTKPFDAALQEMFGL